jgi:hypothetical protein
VRHVNQEGRPLENQRWPSSKTVDKRGVLGLVIVSSGRTPMRRHARPSAKVAHTLTVAEVVKACFEPRVWVMGFCLRVSGVGFSFAMRCVALLCSLCLRLHLVVSGWLFWLFPFSSFFLWLFRPVSRPVCVFGVFGSASLCVA